jgi:aminoglycoside 3-N-acetyltransferase
MIDTRLFRAHDDTWIMSSHILRLLERVGAPDARVLYMHTGLTFGRPNLEIGRQGILQALSELILSMGVPTVCVPTFTFSFCNGEDYNVQNSRSRMGALNEYIRRLPGTIRSLDPLMSSALIGVDRDLVGNLGRNSIGRNSTFDKLHQRGQAVKFLFLGTTASECFTYTHYVEEQRNVSYRYNRSFSGKITSDGRTWEDQYALFVRYRGVVPSSDQMLERSLLANGLLRKETCGESSISCVDEPDAYDMIVRHLEENPRCFVAEDPADKNREFAAHNMVAL